MIKHKKKTWRIKTIMRSVIKKIKYRQQAQKIYV